MATSSFFHFQTDERCNPRSPILVANTSHRENFFVHDRGILDSSASVLSKIMQKLESETDGRLGLQDSVRIFAKFYGSSATLEAVRAAEWWNLIKIDEWRQWLEITDAGRTWAEADPSRLTNFEKVSKMKDRRRTEPSFSIGSNYGVINVARTIKGDSVVSMSGSSDRELLTALRDVLALQEIPWESAELADVREEVETAIAEKDAHRAGLKTAIPKLFRVCRDLAIGVSSSAIFEVLKSYLT